MRIIFEDFFGNEILDCNLNEIKHYTDNLQDLTQEICDVYGYSVIDLENDDNGEYYRIEPLSENSQLEGLIRALVRQFTPFNDEIGVFDGDLIVPNLNKLNLKYFNHFVLPIYEGSLLQIPQIWVDEENDNKPYIVVNNEITYLSEIN